jgi:hypothetical protein
MRPTLRIGRCEQAPRGVSRRLFGCVPSQAEAQHDEEILARGFVVAYSCFQDAAKRFCHT